MASPCCLECYLEVGIASYDRPCPRALAAAVKSAEATVEARLLARAELAEARWSEQTQRIAPDMKKLMQKTVELTGQVGSLEARNRELAAQLNVLWDKYEEREHEVRRLQKLLDGASDVAQPASITMSEAVANTVAAFKHPWELEMDRLLAVQKGWDDAKKHRHAALYKGADKKAVAELLPELQRLEALRLVVVNEKEQAEVPNLVARQLISRKDPERAQDVDNPIGALHEWCQQRGPNAKPPQWELSENIGTIHAPKFRCVVRCAGQVAEHEDSSKSGAKRAAAQKMLTALAQLYGAERT